MCRCYRATNNFAETLIALGVQVLSSTNWPNLIPGKNNYMYLCIQRWQP